MHEMRNFLQLICAREKILRLFLYFRASLAAAAAVVAHTGGVNLHSSRHNERKMKNENELNGTTTAAAAAAKVGN
jgi:hypothetical protein